MSPFMPYALGLSCFSLFALVSILWEWIREAIENRYRAPRYRNPWSSDL